MFGQFKGNAEPGSWGIGVITMTTIIITIYSWFFGERNGSTFDWITFILSLVAIPLWLFIKDPTYAACAAATIDLVAFWPTISKSWRDPYSENLFYYIAWLIKYPTAYFALTNVTIANAVYPVLWTLVGVVFVVFLVLRRNIYNFKKK